MTAFLVVLVLVFLADLLVKIQIVARGVVPERKMSHILVDGLFGVCMVAWAIGLLARGVS